MIVRRWAMFQSDLPTDEIEGPTMGSDFVQYPGRSVADALAEVLRSLGCDVEPPMHEAGHGWELSIRFASASYWGKVSLADEYYFRFDDPWRFWWSLMRRRDPVYLDILSKLAAALRSDDRFRNVRWFTDAELHQQRDAEGAIEPVSA